MASVDIFNNLTSPTLKTDGVPSLTMSAASPTLAIESSPITGSDSSKNCSSDSSMSSSSSSSICSNGNCEPLTMNDIKLFESLDMNGADDYKDAIIEITLDGALEENDSMLSDANQICKICK